MCEEISDALHEIGQMSVAELSKNFSLPNSFLLEVRICVIEDVLLWFNLPGRLCCTVSLTEECHL